MGIRQISVALGALSLCVAVGCATVPAKRGQFNPEGVYTHAFTGLAFPEHAGRFDRQYVTEYDSEPADVSGHYAGPNALPIVATVYHYPATAGAVAPTKEEFITHFEQTKLNVGKANPGAELVRSGGFSAEINGFELSGAHASFSIPEFPAYSGAAESHLYLFVLDGWYLKFRFSHPVEVTPEALPLEQEFLRSFTWPIPE